MNIREEKLEYDVMKHGSTYVYYEIWTTVSEWSRKCVEKCVSFEIAKSHMMNHSDWCRPAGTGRIIKVLLRPDENGTINENRTEVYRQ